MEAARALQAEGATAHRRSARRAASARPPEGMPSQSELAAHARSQLADAVRLARWADGTPHGPVAIRVSSSVTLPAVEARRAAEALELTAEGVRTAWEHARLAGLLELREGLARPGWRLRVWDTDNGAVLRGWVALFDAWSLASAAPEGSDPALVAEVVESAPQLLSLLHLTSDPLPVAGLLELLAQRVAELRVSRSEPDLPEPGGTDDADELTRLLDWLLDALAAVGALGRDRQGHTVSLSGLGNWAVWTKIEQICVAAQSVAGHIEQPAEELLRACARYSPGPARAEYRAWLAARPVGQAVDELLEVARGEDPLLRGLAFEALRVVGGAAESAVRSAGEEPHLRPYALLWLAELDGEEVPADLLSRQEATWLWVDTAAAVVDHGEGQLLVRHLQSAAQGSVLQLLEELREVDHPRTVQVLVALAAAHPDPVLAKVVRRAAFQVHTGS
ncbi:hypothetical protein GCM10012280_05040 [Wenjunlia tyrosinilytica]|uniref:Uncharacterized protein n=1 Tax=Wenjunlia tyrosinilytica TaxID=1544741 RepID=A0A918DRL2_9ACTN|nr:hypothetical protein GCM10012280_05040 [Wenjunlia tyrosinilytica]